MTEDFDKLAPTTPERVHDEWDAAFLQRLRVVKTCRSVASMPELHRTLEKIRLAGHGRAVSDSGKDHVPALSASDRPTRCGVSGEARRPQVASWTRTRGMKPTPKA